MSTTEKISFQEQLDKRNAVARRLEKLAKTNPGGYKLRVLGLALGGCAYIWSILLVLALLGVGATLLIIKAPYVAIKLGLPLLALIGLIIKSLFIKYEPIKGFKVKRQDAPELFALVESIQGTVKCPKVDEILISEDFNAALVQKPRLGILGWNQSTLILGLPLMQSLTFEQFKGVLSHEMGHLSGRHGAMASWIYGARNAWCSLLKTLESERSFARIAFERFFHWYVPYFDTYSFVLARAQEYEADRCSVDLVGSQCTAQALTATQIRGQFLQNHFWKPILEGTRVRQEPPMDVYFQLRNCISAESVDLAEAKLWVDRALQSKTNFDDTHPALIDRLAGLLTTDEEHCRQAVYDLLPQILSPMSSAAETVFDKQWLESVMTSLSHEWAESIAVYWHEQHERFIHCERQLAALLAKATEALTDEDHFMLPVLSATVHGFAQAQHLFVEALARTPDHAKLNYCYGTYLVELEHPDCVHYLEHALTVSDDAELALSCCQDLYNYYCTIGTPELGAKYMDQGYDRFTHWMLASSERDGLTSTDTFSPHTLSVEQVHALTAQLAQVEGIARAYVLEKVLKYKERGPLYVLVVTRTWSPFADNDSALALLEKLSEICSFPGETLLIDMQTTATPQLKKTVNENNETLVYDKKQPALALQ